MEPVPHPRVFSNRYELTHLIARGGMAQVYRARDQLLDRPVALKVLFPELSVDRAFVERFRREAQAAANLSHPNIVPVFDWGEDDGTYFIVMEFVDGSPLSAILRASGVMSAGRAADITAHVAAALAYAHRHGVIHRDVKPGNVLITEDGQVKVTDFGIARAVNTEESLTQTGAVMGTATYFSPEQAEGMGVDSRSDIYSLGVVLFEMVTGRPPFLGDTPVAVASKHVRDQPPLPRDLNPSVPVALQDVIVKAMAKSPERRYATAEEMRSDLLRFAGGAPVHAAGAATMAQAVVGATQAVTAVGGAAAAQADEIAAAEARRSAEATRRRRTRRLATTLGVLVVVLALVAVVLLRTLGYLGTTSFALPDVTGQSQSVAVSTLQAKGLQVSTVNQASASPVGDVVSTRPPPGTKVASGDRVVLTLSAGEPKKVSVPSVVDKQFSDAVAILQGSGLSNYKEVTQTSSKPSGQVLKQSPAADTQVTPDTVVVLTVSAQTTVPVPPVTGMTQTAAGSALGSANLLVGNVTSQCSTSNVATGLVISSSPAAGTGVKPKSPVDLVVSTGPCQVVVQNVVGQTQQAATTTLQGQQLQVTSSITSNCPSTQNGLVVGQTPTGGTQVNTPDTVTIYVCNAPTTPTSGPTVTQISPTQGPAAGGTTVTITGSGFDSSSVVYFGTAKATAVTVASAGTSITCTSPAGSAGGSVPVTVQTAAGTSPQANAPTFSYT